MSSVAFFSCRASLSSAATSCSSRTAAASRSSSTTSRTHRRRASAGGNQSCNSVTTTVGLTHPVAMKRQLDASRALMSLTPPSSPNPNITCSKTGTATISQSPSSSSSSHGVLGLTATAAGAGACLLMGMSHENQKHRSQHFCEAHSNIEDYDEKEEFWEDEAHSDGEALASSHYAKNTLLHSPLLSWLQDMSGGREHQKENLDPLKDTTIKFVDPSLPIPVTLDGNGGTGGDVLDLTVGEATERVKDAVPIDVSHSPIIPYILKIICPSSL